MGHNENKVPGGENPKIKPRCKKIDTEPQLQVKEKEIHNTQYIDKELPTITIIEKNCDSMTEWDELTISISDATAEGALNVFKKVMKSMVSEDE